MREHFSRFILTHLAALKSSFTFIFMLQPHDVSSLDFILPLLCLLSHTQTVCVCQWYFISVPRCGLWDEWRLLWQRLMRMQWNKQIVSVRRDKWDCKDAGRNNSWPLSAVGRFIRLSSCYYSCLCLKPALKDTWCQFKVCHNQTEENINCTSCAVMIYQRNKGGRLFVLVSKFLNKMVQILNRFIIAVPIFSLHLFAV